MRASEWIECGYFALLAAMAVVRRLPLVRRTATIAVGAAMCAAITLVAAPATPVARDWMPAIAILVGYYLSGGFFVAPTPWFERWLIASDRRLLGDPTTRFARWPVAVTIVLEVTYAGTFLLIPLGCAALMFQGRGDRVPAYWTMVIAAEFGSFAPLAFLQSRPPWRIERPAALPDPEVHAAALQLVQRFTTGSNTFPSGHVAGSLAISLAILPVLPAVGTAFLAAAIGIAVACVVGRYHYAMDVAAGAALALAIWAIAN
ncbi:MAG TPA: phosphatase PAP2 family protein [Vicinamibacterales bacterium]